MAFFNRSHVTAQITNSPRIRYRKQPPRAGEPRRKRKARSASVAETLGFPLANPNVVHSRHSYNKSIVDDSSALGAEYVKENLLVETSVYFRAYSSNRINSFSLIYCEIRRPDTTSALLAMHGNRLNGRKMTDKPGYALEEY